MTVIAPLSEMSKLEMFGISAMQLSRICEPPERNWKHKRATHPLPQTDFSESAVLLLGVYGRLFIFLWNSDHVWSWETRCDLVLTQWPNLRKHSGREKHVRTPLTITSNKTRRCLMITLCYQTQPSLTHTRAQTVYRPLPQHTVHVANSPLSVFGLPNASLRLQRR